MPAFPLFGKHRGQPKEQTNRTRRNMNDQQHRKQPHHPKPKLEKHDKPFYVKEPNLIPTNCFSLLFSPRPEQS
jgi:hypothetical protein